MVDSCGECEYCVAGEEQFCLKGNVQTYNGREYDGTPTYGGYSQQIVVKDRFVVDIPERIELHDAAPLLCAGITTYVPLKHWRVAERTKVAVVGMGGLGHVGVRMAGDDYFYNGFRRSDFGNMEIAITIDDPKAYTKPWTGNLKVHLLPDTEILEMTCENSRGIEHMVGK